MKLNLWFSKLELSLLIQVWELNGKYILKFEIRFPSLNVRLSEKLIFAAEWGMMFELQ